MPFIVQSGVIFDDFVVKHYQVLHDLTARFRRFHCLLILTYFIQKHINLIDAFIVLGLLLALLLLLVVLVHRGPGLPLQRLDHHVHAVVRVLHHQPKRCLLLLLAAAAPSPHERYAVRVVQVPLNALQSRQREPTQKATHVL